MDSTAPEAMQFEDLTLDVAGRRLIKGCHEVKLRYSEFELLLAFINAPGRALRRDHLLEAVAGPRSESFDRSIDVLVSRLRRKVESDPAKPRLIVTVPGVGYRFTAHPQPASTPDNVKSLPSALTESAPAVPEIRQVTVLHCLVSGPALTAAYRDPENLHRLLTGFLAYSVEGIRHAGGTMSSQFSNAFQIYFEYLSAHENAVERAIEAAFVLIEAAGKLDTGETGVLQARIGIASGPTIVGDLLGDRGRKAALGGAANMAAVLAASAEPNMVLLCDPAPHSIRELFEVREHVPVVSGGWIEAVPAWQIIGGRAIAAGADPKLWPTRPEANCDLSHTPGTKDSS